MEHFITTFGYIAVLVLMIAESACIPVPSELVMPLGGALAAGAVAGTHPNLILIIAAGTLGNVIGSYVAWAVGRYGGRPVVRRWGRYVWMNERDVERAERWFGRHGFKAVFLGRMLPVIRTFISLPAGFAAIEPIRFGVYTLLGSIPWLAALAGTGYALGDNWKDVVNAVEVPSYAIAGIVAVLLVAAIVVFIRHRRPGRAGEPVPEGE